MSGTGGHHQDDEELRWLDEQEKAAWTGLISLVLLLPGKLESPLRQEHGLTLFEYLVLSHLSEAPRRTLRMESSPSSPADRSPPVQRRQTL